MNEPFFVRAGGLRLRVARQGAGRPLLLITGIGASLEMWAPLARRVSDRELIAFDKRCVACCDYGRQSRSFRPDQRLQCVDICRQSF